MIHQQDPSKLVETSIDTGQAVYIINCGLHQKKCWISSLIRNGIIKHFDYSDNFFSANLTYGKNFIRNKRPRVN